MNEPVLELTKLRANAINGTRHVFVRDLELMAVVGVLEHEKKQAQKIVISVDLTVREGGEGGEGLDDRLENVVCYGQVVDNIKSIIARGHVNLIETLAEMIAASALEDKRVLAARVRIEKPDIIPECASVGIEIERLQAG
jgi:dihydroneopterin aldolase